MGCWQLREVGRGRYRNRGALSRRVSRRDIASGCLRWQLAKTVGRRVGQWVYVCLSVCLAHSKTDGLDSHGLAQPGSRDSGVAAARRSKLRREDVVCTEGEHS
jgi:hypothetical protein